MSRESRREAARREERRARRQAKLQAVRLLRKFEAEAQDADLDLDRWPFPCALVCGNCGQLHWPDQGNDHPMRRETGERRYTNPCSHCDTVSWIDLASKPMARALVDAETFDANLRSSSWRFAVRDLFWGGLASSMGLSLAVDCGSLFSLGSVAVSAAALLTAGTLRVAKAGHEARGGDGMPRRWSMAPPPRGKWVRQVTATAHGEPITAPLSGRPCLGYEVALRWDDHGGAPLATWALVEQRVNLDPATTLQEGAAVHLALPRERLDLTSASASAEVVRYLQTRGLDFTDGSLTIYESIIEPGMRIELTERTGGFIVKPAC